MNSIKTFMNKVGERVREVAPQTSVSIVDGTEPLDGGVEGFVCPACFFRFASPEALEKHYAEMHLDPSANYLCPVCKARLNSQTDLELHYSSNHGEKDFNSQSLEVLREELMELSTSLREERWYSEELKKEVERFQEAFKKKDTDDSEVYIHKSQLDAVEESKNILSKEVVMLKKQLSESIELSGNLRSERDNLEQRASDFAVERAELRATLDSLQAEKVGMESELHDLKSSSSSELSSHKVEVENLTQENSKLESAVNSKLKEIRTQKEREFALQQDLKFKSETVASLKEEMRDLKVEIDLMKKKVQDRSDEVFLLTTRVREHEEEIAALNLAKEAALRLKEIESIDTKEEDENCRDEILRDKVQEIESLSSRLAQSDKERRNAEDLTREKLRQIDGLNEDVASMTNSFNAANSRMIESALVLKERDETIELLEEKHKTFEELQLQLEEKTKVLATTDIKLKEHIDELQNAQIQIAKLTDELQSSKSELESSCQKIKFVEAKLENESALLQEKNKLHEEVQNKYYGLCSVKEEIAKEISEANCNIETLNVSLQEFRTRNENLKDISQESNHKIEKLSNELDSVTQQSVNQLNRISQLEEELKTCRDHLLHQSEDFTSQIGDLEQKCNNMKEEQDALRSQLLSERTDGAKIEKRNQQLSKEVTQVKDSLKEKESLIKNFLEELESYKEHQSKLKEKISSVTQELQTAKDKVIVAEENISIESAKVIGLEGQLSSQEAEIAGLAGDKLELEVKVESAADEQSSLVERCVASESEVERLQMQLTQLRRKLDDSTAALHELGRENQSLQMETSKLAGRKWTEDSEAPNCSRCAKAFSITIRRHHCRNCCQIFCNDCSSKQAPLEANKRPVRVCDSCHAELLTKG